MPIRLTLQSYVELLTIRLVVVCRKHVPARLYLMLGSWQRNCSKGLWTTATCHRSSLKSNTNLEEWNMPKGVSARLENCTSNASRLIPIILQGCMSLRSAWCTSDTFHKP
mmetsp:Transcript_61425/g.146488  ORF Transcript_61425/g.146488 Transcript_61425/m.146488 type:complete len:110 (-) Transcript_61425:742-1071(-)